VRFIQYQQVPRPEICFTSLRCALENQVGEAHEHAGCLKCQVFLHPVGADVQTFVASISLCNAFSDVHSASWAVVALIVLTALNLNKASSQIRIRDQLINESELRRDVERLGDGCEGGIDEGFAETRRRYYDNALLSRLIGLNGLGDNLLLVLSHSGTGKVP